MKRRTLLQWAALAAPGMAAAQPGPSTRAIPSSGEPIPRVGLGTWITFNVGNDPPARAHCAQVMRAFFEAGGRLIDSSPMYGSSQGVVGEGLRSLGAQQRVFAADKVWTGSDGAAQLETSLGLWQVPRFDLLQVHNLLAWEKQLPLLQKMKDAGRLRYVGITTSEGRRHREFEQVMRQQRLDFVQFTYNLLDREAEQRLLPLAAERGLAVLINRPFQEGDLLRRLQRFPLPPWAGEIGCTSWAQFALKFVISHPAVTCAIPATRRVDHVRENMAVARGSWPDAATRQRMAAYVAGL
ncbi:aldo/keto reductase [Ramlibacter alkalitolerans]|uniref:Aldo/keto reductase n=1 Tax=Ramlibacter alkalitolerans TaxID=2039631 RepID=A0ABS1JUX6_9BURK|nr:aldo/keto reductase [Ramlibacter alkalitolerans]MBL0428009.1 aldo/keto reductase [Ramlibacter alkalitolerans]